jgi:hypothetical protein
MSRQPRITPTLLCLAAAALAACSGPDVTSGPGANPSAARGRLVASARDGQPVPLVIDTVPPSFPGGASEVAGTATANVTWLGSRFEPVGPSGADPGSRRLVFRFENVSPDPVAVCSASPPHGSLSGPPLRLYGVFCDAQRPVADVAGTASGSQPEDARQLVAAVTSRLFPGSETGYSTYFPGVSLGVGVGSGGGWGLGGGLHF